MAPLPNCFLCAITYVSAREKQRKQLGATAQLLPLLFLRDRVRDYAKEAVGRRRHHGRRNGRKKRECRRPLRHADGSVFPSVIKPPPKCFFCAIAYVIARICMFFTPICAILAVYTRVFSSLSPSVMAPLPNSFLCFFTYVIELEKQRKLLGGGAIHRGRDNGRKKRECRRPLMKMIQVPSGMEKRIHLRFHASQTARRTQKIPVETRCNVKWREKK
jgi:hypothetical protein